MQPISLLALFLATIVAYQLPVPLGASSVASTRCQTPTMLRRPRGRKASKPEVIPDAPAEAFIPVDVMEAADEISDAIDAADAVTPAIDAPARPSPKLPDVDMEAVEDFAIYAFKFASMAVRGVIDFSKENDILGKAQSAASAAVAFEKDNEVLLKTRAALEVGAENLAPLAEKAKTELAKSQLAKKPVVAKGAKQAVPKKAAVTKRTTKKPAAKTPSAPKFELPKFEMPKLK